MTQASEELPLAARGRGVLLAALSIAALLALLVWKARTPSGDGPHLVGVELRLAQLVRDGELARAFRLFSTLLAPQPPAGYLPGIASFVVLGTKPWAALVAMAVPLALIWDALRRLGASVAWLAVVASPMVWLYTEQHGRDLVCAAVVLQALSWLDLSDRRKSAVFGAWMGVGFLTKYTFPAFLLLPCLLAFRPRHGRNLLVAIGIFALVCGPWFLSYGPRVWAYLHRSAAVAMDAETLNARGDLLSREALLYYPIALKDALGWPGVAAVLIGVATRPTLPLAGALGGVAVLSTMQTAQDRYALPALVCLIACLAPLATRAWGWPILVAAFVPQLAGTVRAFAGEAETHGKFDHADVAALAWPSPHRAYVPTDFDVARWRVDEAVRALAEVHGRPDGTVGLLIPRLPDAPEFGIFLLRSAWLGYRWDFASVNLARGRGGMDDEVFVGPLRDGAWPPRAFTALYALQPRAPDPAAAAWLAAHPAREHARFALPDGAAGVVYRTGP
ncbi:MAG: hypothetical protein ACOZNI_12155 [Myxococcota bacterium]